MREVVSLLPSGAEEEEVFPWFRSRLIPRRPDVFDNDDPDVALEDSPDPTPLVENTTVHSDYIDDVIAKPPLSELDRLYSVVLPLALAGAVVMVMVLVTSLLARRRKSSGGDGAGSSIVVYPYHQSSGPQFLTKEIRFSLPTLRQASSLGDLLPGDNDAESDRDTDSLVPASAAHTQRSNSFSCYGLGAIDPALYRGTLDLEEDLQFPDGHLGRIWFSLRYEPATEKLLVSLLKAKNLPSRTVGTVNSCDPFVRLRLTPDERRYLQSKQKKKTCNPYFDETFVFQVPSKELTDHVLKLTVIDAGKAKRRGVIGYVTFRLRDLPAENEQILYKMDLEKEAQESISDLGEMLVSLLYNENLHRLSVTVIEARRLKLREGRSDSYVRVSLSQHCRTVKVKRTATVKGTDSPNFSECFNFRVPAAQVDVTSVGFQVLQSVSGYGRDKLIGKFVLGSYMFARGKALTHWNSAFSNPMDQVQHWHALCE
ncbi:synaptotagmin-15-like isoform X2 [Zootermopsis nevadensis]|uniref:synaptotagmin-15-like isoform X2 n=1 Tax=Zootermopsis nevadensis TaxID=136037 RepID=UPI000B8E84A3|nr:synaptotagmin-15-like isoform X2 [Zootermopsis nevadensis]